MTTKNRVQKFDPMPDLNAPTVHKMPDTIKENILPNGQLRTQFGGRIRLSNDDREALRAAYRVAKDAEAPTEAKQHTGSSIRTVTRWGSPELDRALGMDDILFAQIVSSRDPLSLGILLKLQKVLNVEIVTRTHLEKCFKSYLDHLEKYTSELRD